MPHHKRKCRDCNMPGHLYYVNQEFAYLCGRHRKYKVKCVKCDNFAVFPKSLKRDPIYCSEHCPKSLRLKDKRLCSVDHCYVYAIYTNKDFSDKRCSSHADDEMTQIRHTSKRCIRRGCIRLRECIC